MSQGLANSHVVVTRPVAQSHRLCDAIQQVGGNATCLPMLEIVPDANAESRQRCQFISGYDWVIFISQNAVRYALALLPEKKWMESTAVAAIGQSTADALHQAGLPVDIQPDVEMNSEGLLQAFSEESLAAKKILIVRGVGGRDTLAEGLRERQALVDYAEVYRRRKPAINVQQLRDVLSQGIDFITFSSGETLTNFAAIIKEATLTEHEQNQLQSCALVVVSERIKALAGQLGFTGTVIVAREPDNAGLIEAMQSWQRGDNE